MKKQVVTVSRLMTTTVVTVEMDDSLAAIKDIFDNTSFHHLLVVNDTRLLGVVSDRDLFKALSPHLGTAAETQRDLNSLDKKVHQIMTRGAITLPPDATVYDAIEIFDQHKISCIPIVDTEKRVLGILSWRDILRALEKKHKRKSIKETVKKKES